MPNPTYIPKPSFRNRPLLHPLLLLSCTAMLATAAPPTAGDPPPAPPAPLLPPNTPAPAPQTNPDQPHPPGQITQISETKYRIGKIEFEQTTRTITFEATLNMNKGMLEYALVNKTGKVHESLLATDISPFNLNLTLLILKYKPAEHFIPASLLPPDKQPPAGARPSPIDQSNGFDIKVTWEDLNGIKKTARIEDWIHNDATGKNAEHSPFVYTGSQVDSSGTYAAQSTGSIIALFSDPLAMVNNPLQGSDSDEIWSVGADVPPLQTKVQVSLSPHKPIAKKADRK